MRLLFVSHSFPPAGRPLLNVGGMQRVATELCAALAERPDVRLSPLVLHTSWRWTPIKTAPFLLYAGWQIRRLAQRGEIDAVLFSSMVTASLAVPLRRGLARQGVPTAAIAHGLDVTTPFGPYQRFVPRVFRALDRALPVSRATGEACLVRGLDPEKLRVVPNGVRLDRFPPLGSKRAMRRRLLEAFPTSAAGPLPEGALLLCSVGRQVERKGFAWFAEAVMPRLPLDVHYWLAGDGPEEERIRAAVARHDLGRRVRLLGRVSDEELQALYRGADLFVMPNVPVPGDMEGFGVVILEAGLGGLPVVASGLEGIRDVVAEGENGHLVESGDADAFVQAILPYYHDRERLERAAQRAAETTAARFGWPAVAARYADVLRELVAASAGRPSPP